MDRSNDITNWFLRPLLDRIEVIAGDATERLIEWAAKNGIPLANDPFGTVIDWNTVPHCEVDFDYEGSETVICASLRSSDLRKCDRLVLLVAKDEPVLSVATEVFTANWSAFWGAAGYMQLIAFSEDGRYLLEFEDNSKTLYCNFEIQ